MAAAALMFSTLWFMGPLVWHLLCLPSGSRDVSTGRGTIFPGRSFPLLLQPRVGERGWRRRGQRRSKAIGATAFTWLIGQESLFWKSTERGNRTAPELHANI